LFPTIGASGERGSVKQTEIARELGCSQMQISRPLRRAGRRLSEAIETQV
jgi:DNA-directed RNA polymerase specialized sigma subunit